MLSFCRPAAVAALVAFAAVHAARADVVVSSFPNWDNSSGVAIAGTTVAIGQTFTAPGASSTLDAFTIRVNATSTVNGVRAYVFASSGGQATGAALYRSDIFPTMPTSGGYIMVSYTGLNAPVTPGQNYVLLFSNAENGSAFSMNGFQVASMFTGSSAAAPLLTNAVSFAPTPAGSMSGLTSTSWTNLSNSRDLALELRFVSLPTPGALAVAGLGMLAAARRRR
ncbi:MAG: hypothetical protein ACREJO_16595 [Phycisphaerales bacterium]